MKNFIKSEKTFEQLSIDGSIEEAKANNQFVICKLKYPFTPTMDIAVYDPSLNEVDDLLAIFRTIGDAVIFVECFKE